MATERMEKEFVNALVDRWALETLEQEEEEARIPLRVLLGEAMDLAGMIDAHWEDVTFKHKVRLGLQSVANSSGVSDKTSTDLRELQIAAASVQSHYLALIEGSSNAPIERADEVLDELRSGLSFLLEDGNHEKGEDQLERMRDEYKDAYSHDGIAMALEGYAELADIHKEELALVGGFDLELISEALGLGQTLRQRSADKLTGKIPQEQKDTLRLRNRLIGALVERMREARRTIRYVFREYPEVIRKSGSDYRRNQQRSARSKSGSGAPSAAEASAQINAGGGAAKATTG